MDSPDKNDTVVIGLGSLLMTDEGIGIHIIQHLERRDLPGVDLEDLGTSGMAVVHAIAGRRKAVIIDCALLDAPPGTIRRFGPDDVRTRKNLPRLSLHEGDLLDVLDLARRVGNCPDEIVLFGIQPAVIAPGMELSPTLTARLDEYCDMIVAEVLPS